MTPLGALFNRFPPHFRPMSNSTLDQPLLIPGTSRDDVLAPGLLRVLQQAVALRFLLSLLSAALFLALARSGQVPPEAMRVITVFAAMESALLLVFVSWPALRRRLGASFLPIALGWFLLAPLVTQALAVVAMPPDIHGRPPRLGVGDLFMETIWLAVPVMLAAWQYGRRGWQVAMGGLIAGQLALGLLITSSDLYRWGDFIGISLGRLGTVALLGYIVMRLVESLRAEHAALQAANRQLARRAVTAAQLAESRERNRLARELHDTLAHSLTGLSVQLQALETLMTYDPQAARNQLKEAQATVRSGILESRRAIQALRATPLEDLGLSEALRQLCRRQAERMGIAFTCAIDDIDALDPLTEQSIYRIAEAALANVERHAAATTVAVSLSRPGPDRRLRLEITDDGVGFDVDAIDADHFGMAGMRERAELIGADLQIASSPGKGASVVLVLGEQL